MKTRANRNSIFGLAVISAVTIVVFGSIFSARLQAQSTLFYKDKTIRIIVGFSAGGLYDHYARILARHMGKHIPGNPNIIVQNMPGAGSLTATSYVFGVAKPDGLTLGMPGSGIYLDQMLGRKEVIDRVKKLSKLGPVELCICRFMSGIYQIAAVTTICIRP